MTVRLHWNLPDHQEGGAFTLRGAPLHLVVSSRGVLDVLHQDPGDRDGLTVTEESGGALRVTCRGQCRVGPDGTSGKEARLPLGAELSISLDDFHWDLTAEGKVETPDPLVGTELGGHRVVARLGNGSMGVVYRAVQINLDREVALKVLDPKAAKASPLAVASFKREAVAAGRLSHPNLVQVYDVGQDRGLHFFSMELVAAGDLEDKLKE
ncbi:MAG: protein kinase domain-containing protein, partial [Planctomycetota bacterium]